MRESSFMSHALSMLFADVFLVSDELVDIYDDNMKKIGIATRYEAHAKGEWHLNFHCWVVTHNSGGALLFQVRSKRKPTFPGKLDSTVGGHYKMNEGLRGVMREVNEEIGIKVHSRELVPLGRRLDIASFGGIPKREIANVFLLMRDLSPRDFHPDSAEVEGLLEIRIVNGLKLFSGEVRTVRAIGIKWDTKSRRWGDCVPVVNRRDFVQKADSYYLTVFIMAERFLAGEKYLSI